jgi:hypothetical protein
MELIAVLLKNVGLLELFGFIGAIIFFAARLEENNKASKELLSSEIKHVVQLMELNHRNLTDDINRLEKKQEESNRIKERLAMQEVLMSDVQQLIHDHIENDRRHIVPHE